MNLWGNGVRLISISTVHFQQILNSLRLPQVTDQQLSELKSSCVCADLVALPDLSIALFSPFSVLHNRAAAGCLQQRCFKGGIPYCLPKNPGISATVLVKAMTEGTTNGYN